MNEWQQIWLTMLRIIILMLFITCYTIGGRKWKWVRRFIGSIILCSGVIGVSFLTAKFSWWLLGCYPAYIVSLLLGYGGDTTGEKLFKRLICGAVLGSSSLTIGLFTGLWVVCLFQIILATGAHIFFGILNPYKDAVKEEATIALLGVCLVPFLV